MPKKDEDQLLAGCLAFFVIGFVIVARMAVTALCLSYVVNFWLAFGQKPPTWAWWYGAIVGLVPYMGKLALVAAAATFIASFFL